MTGAGLQFAVDVISRAGLYYATARLVQIKHEDCRKVWHAHITACPDFRDALEERRYKAFSQQLAKIRACLSRCVSLTTLCTLGV